MSKVVMGADDVVLHTIALEASNQGQICQLLVGRVIRVRAQQRHLTFQEVCKQRCPDWQFSCWDPNINKDMKKRTPDEIIAADRAWELSEYSKVPVNMYCNADLLGTDKEPSWVSKCEFILIEDDLAFFYEDRPNWERPV